MGTDTGLRTQNFKSQPEKRERLFLWLERRWLRMNMYGILEKSLDLAKEYARGGGSVSPDIMLEKIFNKLKELNVQVEADR